MALVIEDGSIVANANSFVTVAEIRAYALARGITVSATDSEVEPFAIKAMDFIESKEGQFQGSRVSAAQTLPFPRTGVYIYGNLVPDTVIPNAAKRAQLQLALDSSQGVDLMPTVSGAAVKREKVGPLETEYEVSATSGYNGQPDLQAANSWLDLLYGTGGFTLRTVRV